MYVMKRNILFLLLILVSNIAIAQKKLFEIDEKGHVEINKPTYMAKKFTELDSGYKFNNVNMVTDAKGFVYQIETYINDDINDVGFSDFHALKIQCVSDPKGKSVLKQPTIYYNDVWVYWRAFPEYETSPDTVFKKFDLKDCSVLVLCEGGFLDADEPFNACVILLHDGECDIVFDEPAHVTNDITVNDDEISIQCVENIEISDDELSSTIFYKPLRFLKESNSGYWGDFECIMRPRPR